MTKKVIHTYEAEHAVCFGKANKINALIDRVKPYYNNLAKEVSLPMWHKSSFSTLINDHGLKSLEAAIDKSIKKQHTAVRKFYQEDFYKRFNIFAKAWREIEHTLSTFSDKERKSFANATYTVDGSINIDQFKEASLPFFEVTIESKEDFILLEKYNSVANSWNDLLDYIQINQVTRNNVHKATINQLYSISDFSKRAKKNPEILF